MTADVAYCRSRLLGAYCVSKHIAEEGPKLKLWQLSPLWVNVYLNN